jgi:hypothetical protein
VEAGSVGEAVTAAAALADERGRMIVEVLIDGEPRTGDELNGIEGDESPAIEVLLRTANPRVLVGQVLADARAALEEADQFQRDAAELIESDRLAEAMDSLTEALDIWLDVQQAIAIGLQVMDTDADQLDHDGVPIRPAIDRLNHHLQAMRTALSSQDPIGLSDVLLYDLPEIVQQWRELLTGLQRTLIGESNSP